MVYLHHKGFSAVNLHSGNVLVDTDEKICKCVSDTRLPPACPLIHASRLIDFETAMLGLPLHLSNFVAAVNAGEGGDPMPPYCSDGLLTHSGDVCLCGGSVGRG